MKIGILTQPLHTNYGGLLQAFALQKYLRDMGHEVLTVDYSRKPKAWAVPIQFAIRVVSKYLLKRGGALWGNESSRGLDVHTSRFIREYIKTTKKIAAPISGRDFQSYCFEAFIVGSDQTWISGNSPFAVMYTPVMFLSFLHDKSVRRIAYAASFGVDFWRFSTSMTKRCCILAKKFHAISVREDSGVSLCEKYLGISAEHVVDPTMLLSREDYCTIIERDEECGFLEKRISEKRLFTYVLDDAPEKKTLISEVAGTLGLIVEEFMPKREEIASGAKVYPPVSAWLRGFRDAEFVVTDSFHGCVFSIIFNKPFLAIGNANRGMARFISLLKTFELEDRLVIFEKEFDVKKIIQHEIEWGNVFRLVVQKRNCSQSFLNKALT